MSREGDDRAFGVSTLVVLAGVLVATRRATASEAATGETVRARTTVSGGMLPQRLEQRATCRQHRGGARIIMPDPGTPVRLFALAQLDWYRSERAGVPKLARWRRFGDLVAAKSALHRSSGVAPQGRHHA